MKVSFLKRWGHEKPARVGTGVMKNERRLRAIARDKARELRTDAEQLALIATRPGVSERETKRLKHRIAVNGKS